MHLTENCFYQAIWSEDLLTIVKIRKNSLDTVSSNCLQNLIHWLLWYFRYFIVFVWIVAATVASPFLVYRKIVQIKVKRLIKLFWLSGYKNSLLASNKMIFKEKKSRNFFHPNQYKIFLMKSRYFIISTPSVLFL